MARWPLFSLQLSNAITAAHAGLTRPSSDLRDDLDLIPAGAARFQLVGSIVRETAEGDANARKPVVDFEILVRYRLTGAEPETAWTEGTPAIGYGLDDVTETLLDPATYRALGSVYDLGDPDTSPDDALDGDRESIERIGDLISMTFTGRVTLVP